MPPVCCWTPEISTPNRIITAADWHAVGRGTGSTGFRRFDHGPHPTMLRDPGDCTRCHRLAEAGDQPATSRGYAAHQRELCAGCHHDAGAGDACLTCHDYHFQRP